MIVVLIRFLKELHIKLNKNNIYKILLFAFTMIILAAFGFYFFEKDHTAGLTLLDSIWWSFVTLTTVGYGDYFPVTLGGRIIATFLMVIGIGTFGLITASVAAIFVENSIMKGRGMMNIKSRKHIVVIGWNKKAESIVEELEREDISHDVVIISRAERVLLKSDRTFFVHGDAADDEVLERANVKEACLAIVLSDETMENEQMIDARSVLICLAIDKINPDIHIVAEVVDEKNLSHFKRANADDTIVSSKISSKIIVRGALYKHVSKTIEELTTNSYGNEIYQKKASETDTGKSFGELANEFINTGDGILIGVADNDDTMVNTKRDYKIKKDDVLIYISEDKIK